MAEGGISAKMKQMRISAIDPDKAYPMKCRNMGHAVIINNVASEFPGSIADVKELKKTYEILGFQVRVENNCSNMKMRELKKWLLTEETHKDSNCVAIIVICHGNEKGWLMDKDKRNSWLIEDFVGDLSLVGTLAGKPKLMIVQACRGRRVNEAQAVPAGALAEAEEIADQIILPDKADTFIAFATVQGYIADSGDEDGSHYLQAFATFLREQYMKRPLDRIYLMVKQYMTAQGRQCAEERNSLRYLLRFSEHQGGTPVKQLAIRKVPRQVTMRHIKTHDTGLVAWGYTRFTVMHSTGEVVVWGKTSDKDSAMLNVYNSSTTSWEKVRSKSGFCEHEDRQCILPVTIKNQELLAVSCSTCHKIRLYNMTSGEITTAFSDSRYYPGPMCKGDTGQIYVVHNVKGIKPILQLNCSEPKFSVSKTIQSGMEQVYAICHIPRHRLIAVSDNAPGNIIRAVHCDTDVQAWELKGTVDGKECSPHDMVYSPDHDTLLVADGWNCRVLVISPQDGSVTQVVQLSLDMDVTAELCLYKKWIVARHHNNSQIYVSYFSTDEAP